MLPEAERCPYRCSMPEPSNMPGNIVPFMCASAADPTCAAHTSGTSACCEATARADLIRGEASVIGGKCCVEQTESSTAMACRPR